MDDSDSDLSIDSCKVCHRLRSAMNEGRRRSNSEANLYHCGHTIFETQACR